MAVFRNGMTATSIKNGVCGIDDRRMKERPACISSEWKSTVTPHNTKPQRPSSTDLVFVLTGQLREPNVFHDQ